MKLAPVTLERGERYGTLTVLRKARRPGHGPSYQCGCDCGVRIVYATANELLRGKVTRCRRCEFALTATSESE